MWVCQKRSSSNTLVEKASCTKVVATRCTTVRWTRCTKVAVTRCIEATRCTQHLQLLHWNGDTQLAPIWARFWENMRWVLRKCTTTSYWDSAPGSTFMNVSLFREYYFPFSRKRYLGEMATWPPTWPSSLATWHQSLVSSLAIWPPSLASNLATWPPPSLPNYRTSPWEALTASTAPAPGEQTHFRCQSLLVGKLSKKCKLFDWQDLYCEWRIQIGVIYLLYLCSTLSPCGLWF